MEDQSRFSPCLRVKRLSVELLGSFPLLVLESEVLYARDNRSLSLGFRLGNPGGKPLIGNAADRARAHRLAELPRIRLILLVRMQSRGKSRQTRTTSQVVKKSLSNKKINITSREIILAPSLQERVYICSGNIPNESTQWRCGVDHQNVSSNRMKSHID